tara:strand:+ start:1674 stop:1895 length:222 start_codon:yes stop_codon:yes gene_type:complete
MGVVSTTDVVTNPNTSVEATKNGTIVVTCLATGEFDTIDATLDNSPSYTNIQAGLTGRFDDISYYNAVDGGSP